MFSQESYIIDIINLHLNDDAFLGYLQKCYEITIFEEHDRDSYIRAGLENEDIIHTKVMLNSYLLKKIFVFDFSKYFANFFVSAKLIMPESKNYSWRFYKNST